ncbi:GIY-YIG nuclease family protein [Stenotrophomonas maltophilia]|nr:GIY-YIG nuclease family protein [Stenotrophomonas maltophilia]
MPQRHHLGRSEKYHALPRTLYALLFDDGGCYVGQSSNPQQREKQHRSRQGGWHRPFRFHALEVVTATRAEAEAHEQAWRGEASRGGGRIYAKPPGIVVNPNRRATPHVRWLAHQRRWQLGTPGKAPSERVGGGPWVVVVISVLALARCVTG